MIYIMICDRISEGPRVRHNSVFSLFLKSMVFNEFSMKADLRLFGFPCAPLYCRGGFAACWS